MNIIRTLAKSISTHYLTTVAAPAGYGKTTVAQKLLGFSDKNRFYYSVPSDVIDPDHWWDSLFANLAKQGMAAAPTLRGMGFPQSESAIGRVIEAIKEIPAAFTLILDDCQNFVDADIDKFWETLIRAEPSDHRFVMFSRVKPHMNFDDVADAGLATAFDQELLEFSDSEAARLFFLNGVTDKTAVSRACSYSEGWVTALWLCLHNHKRGGEARPTGDINDLLDKAMFAAYSPADQEFLMQLSLFDSFSAAEAATVLAVPDAHERLREISGGNALVRFDAAAGRYVFHSIFKDFLANRLAARDDLNTPDLYRRTAECHAARHEYMTAYRLLAKAGRDEDLIRILDVHLLQNGQNIKCIHVREVLEIVETIPWRLRLKHPLGYVAFVWYNFEDGLDAQGIELLEEMDKRFQRAKEIPAFLKRRIAGEVEFMRGWLNMYNEHDILAQRYQNACKLLDGPSIIRYDRMCWNFCAPHLSFLVFLKGFRYRQGILPVVERLNPFLSKLTGGATQGLDVLSEIEFQLEQGEFENTARMLDDVSQLLENQRNMTAIIVAGFSRARLLSATGDPEKGVAVLNELLAVARSADFLDHIQCAELALGYVLANAMLPDSAPGWLQDCDIFAPPFGDTRIQGFMVTVCGKLLLAKGDFDGLASFLASVPDIFGPTDLIFSSVHAAVFTAILAWRRKNADAALAAIGEAVELTRPDGLILSMAEYGGHILPMLRRLKSAAPDDRHLEKLVELTRTVEQIRSRQEQKNSLFLSKRECEVMRLVVKGKSTTAIAKKMGISESAVKKRITAAYRKLSAKNRAEAAHRFQIEYIDKPEKSAKTDAADAPPLRARQESAPLADYLPPEARAGDLTLFLEAFTLANAAEMTAACLDEACSTMESLPWTVRATRPMEYLAYLWWQFRVSGTRRSGLQVDEAEYYLAEAGRLPRRLAGEIALLRGMLCAHDAEAYWDCHDAARKLLRGASALYSRQTSWTFGNPHFSFTAVREPGGFAALAKRIDAASETLSTLTGGGFQSLAAAFRMERHLERGEMDEAREFLPGMKECGHDDMQAAITAAFAGARILSARGHADAAVASLERLRRGVTGLGSHEHSESLELALGYMYAQLGRTEKIAPWLQAGDVHSSPHCAAARRPFALTVYGKILAATGNYQLLDPVARTMPERFGLYGSLLGRIHAKVLEAIAARNIRDDMEALPHLRAAVELSRQDGLVFPIAEYGGHVLSLLRRLRTEEPGDRHLRRVAVIADRMQRNTVFTQKTATTGNELTRRELEVMQFVVQGKSNRTIAQKLGISESAIQKTLSNVYLKFGAANRAEAARVFKLRS